MKNWFSVISLIMLTGLLAPFAIAEDKPEVTLQAGVEISKDISPLDPLLIPGNFFDKEVAAAILKNKTAKMVLWKKIPNWQAGVWKIEQSTNTKAVKYSNGKPESEIQPLGVHTCGGEEVRGKEMDKKGDIWDVYLAGYWTETFEGENEGYSYITSRAPGDSRYPDSYTESIAFTVDRKTKKILNVLRRRTWEKDNYLAPGIMRAESVHTTYKDSGEPFVSSWNTSIERKAQDFTSLHPAIRDKVLHQDFIAFLSASGMKDLIPPDESGPVKPTAKIKSAAANHSSK